MQQIPASSPYPYYYYTPVPVEGDQQQVPMIALVDPKPEEIKKESKTIKSDSDAENSKKKRKPKFKKLSGCHKFLVVIGCLSLIGFFMKLIGVGIGLTVLSNMYYSCENPPHRLERQWSTIPRNIQSIRLDITSAAVTVRTCPHAKSINIHSVSRSKTADDLVRMIPSYTVTDGTIALSSLFPAFDFESCASIKVDIVVPENLEGRTISLHIVTETGVVYVLPNKKHHDYRNGTYSGPFADINIRTKAGHVEVAHVHTNGYITAFSKIGGVTLKDVTASTLTGMTQTGFVNAEYIRVGQATLFAESGSVTARGVIFEPKIAFNNYGLQASVDFGHIYIKDISNKLTANSTAAVKINAASGSVKVKLSKKVNVQYELVTENGSLEVHGKDLPKLIEDKENSKSGRIEGHGALTTVSVATGSGRAHVTFRGCNKWHEKHGENEHLVNKENKHDDETKNDDDHHDSERKRPRTPAD